MVKNHLLYFQWKPSSTLKPRRLSKNWKSRNQLLNLLALLKRQVNQEAWQSSESLNPSHWAKYRYKRHSHKSHRLILVAKAQMKYSGRLHPSIKVIDALHQNQATGVLAHSTHSIHSILWIRLVLPRMTLQIYHCDSKSLLLRFQPWVLHLPPQKIYRLHTGHLQ